MVYPPVLYWSYTWTRLFDYPTANYIWTIVIFLTLLFSCRFWIKTYFRKRETYLFLILLLLQFPSVYAMERGNNDIFVVAFWTLLFYFWNKKKYFIAGLFGALSFLFKLYPAFSLLLIGIYILIDIIQKKQLLKPWKHTPSRFVFGALFGIIAGFFLLYEQNRHYFFEILPQWSSARQPQDVSAHSLYSLLPNVKNAVYYFQLLLLLSWIYFGKKIFNKDAPLALAGALAYCTFYPNISNDYNFVTLYPLWTLLFVKAFQNNSLNKDWMWLFITGVTVVSTKVIMRNMFWNITGAHLMIEYIWFLIFPIIASRKL